MAHSHIQRRLGITRVEVTVLCVVVVILIALAVLGIQHGRETYNTHWCKDNLRKIAIASHDFHNDHHKLPAGYYSAVFENGKNSQFSPDRGPHIGCMAMLLPYLEQDAVFRKLCNSASTWPQPNPALSGTTPLKIDLDTEYKPWWSEPANLQLSTGMLAVERFRCPADSIQEDNITEGIVSLQINTTSFRYITIPGAEKLGRTNYLGVAGAAGDHATEFLPFRSSYPGDASYEAREQDRQWEKYIGCLHNRSRLTLGQLTVQDGTSNTLLFGESLGSTGVGPRKTAFPWFGAGALGTVYGLGRPGDACEWEKPTSPPMGVVPTEANKGASWYRFSSRHKDGVMFAFGDASVRRVKFDNTTSPDMTNGIDNRSTWACLQQLAARRDGLTRDFAAIPE